METALPILIEMDKDVLYIVSCPLFKGCHSWGETIDEAIKNISEVIEMYLEDQTLQTLPSSTKGKIESTVGFVKRDFFLSGSFSSFSDTNNQLQIWPKRVNALRTSASISFQPFFADSYIWPRSPIISK